MLSASYSHLLSRIEFYYRTLSFENFEAESIGTTYDNRRIYSLRFGPADYSHSYVLTASIHGREYINTALLLSFADELASRLAELNQNKLAFFLLPMLNPDGVAISMEGSSGLTNRILEKGVSHMLHTSLTRHKRWKANACGVDLNRNFPSGWRPAGSAGAFFYSGEAPADARETRALMNYMHARKEAAAIIHYHSCGNLVYWDYHVSGALRQQLRLLAKLASQATGYRMETATPDTAPGGGFGDWCVYHCHIPSITIETGRLFSPVPTMQFPSIKKRNLLFLDSLIKGELPFA